MDFRSLASKIATVGQYIPYYGSIFKTLLPTKLGDKVEKFDNKVLDTSTRISHIILDAQVTGEILSLSGPDKLKLVLPKLTDIIANSEALSGAEVMDEKEFAAGIIDLNNAWNRILKSVKKS